MGVSPQSPPSLRLLCLALEQFRLMVCSQRIDHVLEVAIHELLDVVSCQPNAMVGHAVLRKIVRADFFGAVSASDL